MTATTQHDETTDMGVILHQESDQVQIKEANGNEKQQQHEDESLFQQRQDLLNRAKMLYQEDKLSQVAKILKSIDSKYLTNEHHVMLQRAQEAENLVKDLKAHKGGGDQEGDWIDHGISGAGGKFPTRILYRLEKSANDTNDSKNNNNNNNEKVKLRARCETPIQKELLEPLLSVLNETELYETWLPSFQVPKFRIRHCTKLKQCSRVSQILWVAMELPWPMAGREVVLSAAAFDAIEDDGHIGIKLKTIKDDDDDVVPEVGANMVRVDLDGGFLFESCPKDHPAMSEFQKNQQEENTNHIEECILVTFSAVMDPHVKFLPQSFLNFLVKTALGTAWRMLLSIAQDVKDGKRPDHARAIEQKRQEVYDYVRERVDVMLSSMKTRHDDVSYDEIADDDDDKKVDDCALVQETAASENLLF